MKKFFIILMSGMFLSMLVPAAGFAGEIAPLVNTLVQKDVLSPAEGQSLIKESEAANPAWVQSIKFKGDLRVRYQTEKKDTTPPSGSTTSAKRERGRIRFRLGGSAKPTDDWKVYWRIDTGGTTDPRSTNATMDNNFTEKSIVLGQAYAVYKPIDNAELVMGKIKRGLAIWTPDDLLWDGDVNPEGGAIALKT